MHIGEIVVIVLLLFAGFGVLGYGLSIYNGLIALKNDLRRAWSNIDVLLKQRHDELPKLIAVCEVYMQHERAVFESLGQARAALAAARTIPQRAEAESGLPQ